MSQIGDNITENDYGIILHTESEVMIVDVSRKLHPLEIGQAITGLLLLLEPDERMSIMESALNNINTNDLNFGNFVM